MGHRLLVVLIGLSLVAVAWAQDSSSGDTIPGPDSQITKTDMPEQVSPQALPRQQGYQPSPSNPPSNTPIYNAWMTLGEVLKTACRMQQGHVINLPIAGFNIPFSITHPPVETEWICSVARTWGFVNSLVHTDWKLEFEHLVGHWLGDLASITLHGIILDLRSGDGSPVFPDMRDWAEKVEEFNKGLKEGYQELRRRLYNAIWDAAKGELQKLREMRYGNNTQSANSNLPDHVQAVNNNKEAVNAATGFVTEFVALMDGIDRGAEAANKGSMVSITEKEINKPREKTLVDETGEQVSPVELVLKGLDRKIRDYNPNAKLVDPITGQTLTDPITGQPMENTAQKVLKGVEQAPDTRTAIEGLTKAVLEVAHTGLYGDKAVVEALMLILDQGIETNKMLLYLLKEQGIGAAQDELVLRQRMEAVGEEMSREIYMYKLQRRMIQGMAEGVLGERSSRPVPGL